MKTLLAKLIFDKIIKEKFSDKPTVVGGEKVRREYEEKLVVNKKKAGSVATLITAIIMAILMHFDILTQDQADIVDDVLEDKVEQLIESRESL